MAGSSLEALVLLVFLLVVAGLLGVAWLAVGLLGVAWLAVGLCTYSSTMSMVQVVFEMMFYLYVYVCCILASYQWYHYGTTMVVYVYVRTYHIWYVHTRVPLVSLLARLRTTMVAGYLCCHW